MTVRFVAVWLVSVSLLATATRAEDLTIGSPAPAIAIEHWFHNKKPISSFEEGRVYVIEFWATWCPPCIASMPHLAEIQEKHGDLLTVIGISDEDPETVEEFLDREQDEVTFREISSEYWLTTDPDDSVRRDYMQAAGERGIPKAFIIGKTGLIEWIGSPMRMDEPVAQILAGVWDREAYAADWAEEKLIRGQIGQIARLMQRNKYEEALAKLDELIAAAKSERVREGLEQGRKRAQADAAKYARAKHKKDEESARVAKEHAETVASLLDVAFLVKEGNVVDASAVLDGVIESATNEDVKRLLEEARAKLTGE